MGNGFQCHTSRGIWGSLLLLLILAVAGTAHARTETFTWQDANPLPSPVVGFRIHLGSSSGNYATVLDVGMPAPDASGVFSASAQVADAAVVYVAMTAYDFANRQSGFSNEQVRSPTDGSGGAPTASPDAYAVNQDAVLVVGADSGVLANDSDPDSDPMMAVLVTDVTSGSLLLNGDGSFQYSPAPGYFGTDAFTYHAADGNTASNLAAVTITVVPADTNLPPDGSIDSPTGPVTITAGDSVVFAGSGTDPDGNVPLTYRWLFSDPAIAPSSAADPGAVVFSQAGTFNALFFVTDSAGLKDPTPAIVTIVVEAESVPPPEGSVGYIGDDSVWRYFDAIPFFSTAYPGHDAQGDAWSEAGFDDSAWPTGSGLFGFGDLDGFSPDTVVISGNITYLFRTAFDVVDRLEDLTAYVLRDDAFVIYLNGVEVARRDISDPIDANTRADVSVEGAEESAYLPIALDPTALVTGTNTLAVEVHNFKKSNSDLGFALHLVGSSSGNGSFPSANASVDVERVATGFDSPVYLTSRKGDPRLFVLEAGGRIRIVENGSVSAAPFLDLSFDVSEAPGGGLLGLVFDPDYERNGYFYVHRTAANGDSVLSRFAVSNDPEVADVGSEQVLLRIPQPFDGQNGGAIAFGPDDGFLYVGLADGGSTGDPGNRAQDGDSLLGKLLRLDVGVPPAPDSIPNGTYAIPSDNPFVGDPGVRDEIWAIGLRNPYRFSFDRELWDLWLADEGQDLREEVNFEPRGASGGNNYGWDVMEGSVCNADDPAPAPSCNDVSLVPPLYGYSHTNGNCAITGGYVYRGGAPDLVGQYFFGDFCSGGVWSLDALTGDGTDWTQALGEAAGKPDQLVSFGEGGNGDLYILHVDGDIYRIGSTDPVCDEGTDSDCDGIPNDGAAGDMPCATGQSQGCDDNCPFASNPGQEDTGGIGSGSAPDGIGNECQCGDVSGDGAVSSVDSVIILRSLLSPPTAAMSRPDLCDVGAGVGCTEADSEIVLGAQLVPPTATIQQVCAPANPPLQLRSHHRSPLDAVSRRHSK